MAAVIATITSPIANSATTARRSARCGGPLLCVVEVVVDPSAVGVSDDEHRCEHHDVRSEVGTVVGVEQIHRAADESYGLDETRDDEDGDADGRATREK